MLSIYLIIALTLYEFSYIPGSESCVDGELEHALNVNLDGKNFINLCPADEKKDIEKLKSLSSRFNLYLLPYCLFRKPRKRNEEILCKSELKPLFKTYKNLQTKEDISCGSEQLQILHFLGYYFCGWMNEAMDKLRSIKKQKHLIEYNEEYRPKDIPMYDVCFNIATHETLHTIHSVLQPSVYLEEYFQEECYCSRQISTDEFYMNSGSFSEIEGNYQAELDKDPENEFRTFPQPLVPPQHYAYRAWKKSTDHYINRAPLSEHLIPLMNVIDEAVPPPEVIWMKKDIILANKTFTSKTEPAILQISLDKLKRSDLHTEFTCQATNNNRSQPLSAVVQIDMNFSPLDVRIIEPNQPFTASRKYELICQSVGSRPPAKLTWWKDGRRLEKTTKDSTASDGNSTTSVLTFIPAKSDDGKRLSCKASNEQVSNEVLETGWDMNINFLPESDLRLGKSLKPDTIKEGADVYFDCFVTARPPTYKVEWKLNGRLLQHNVGQGIIISNYSLVLQRVSRQSAGNYTCKAYNTEGEGESNVFNLNVMYSPTCKPNQNRIYGVAKLEKVNISCEVEANPTDVVFKWSFNNSADSISVLPDFISKSGTTSIVSHLPANDLDYGTLLCLASNKVGTQKIPCIYHIIAAGKPDRVSNCTVWNITMTSFSIRCTEGYNGGMPQTFYLEVNSDSDLKANISSQWPRFQVTGLQAGTHYVAYVFATNLKGRSDALNIDVTTLGNSERILKLKEAEKPLERFRLTTTMSIVIGVVISLIVIACIVATALQLHCSRIESRQNKNKLQNEANVYSSNDSVSSGEKNRDNFADKIFLNQNNIVGLDGEEKDPDIIPQPAADIDERRDYMHRRQHVSTIEAKIPSVHNLFAENTLNRSYPSYCTMRNGNMPMQNFSHLNKTNVVIPPKDTHQYGSNTLPRKGCGVPPSVPSTSDGYRYPVYLAHTPISCAIPEEEPSPSSTPLISPKQESAV